MPSKRNANGNKNAALLPEASTTDDAAVRKRKQNRLSQQCLREKRSAGVADQSFFDRLAADIRRLREVCEQQQHRGGGENGGVDVMTELVRINEGLIEENRCLREAVLRMRKKLLSLSGQADAAADDPVFQKILGKESEAPVETNGSAAPNKRRKCSPTADSGSASGRAVESVSSDADDLDRVEPITIDEREILATLDQHEPTGSFNPLISSRFDSRLVAAAPVTQPESMHIFHSQSMTAELFPPPPPATRAGQDFPNFSFSNVPQLSLTNSAILDAWVSRSYANVLGQKIENACVQYAMKARGAASPALPEKALLARLADVAVHMFFDDTGLGNFINRLEGARDFLRTVLATRIMLGCAKPHNDLLASLYSAGGEAVPAPWSTSARPLVVDLMAWPALRDQMAFHGSFYDLDEMAEDVVAYTVVDLPEQRLALQMYCAPSAPLPPQQAAYPTVPRPPGDGGGDAEAGRFRFAEREFTQKVLQAPEREMLDAIARRMEDGVGSPEGSPVGGVEGGRGGHADCLRTEVSECALERTEAERSYQGYRLSDAFFKKYPFLQCASLGSPYPVLPASKASIY